MKLLSASLREGSFLLHSADKGWCKIDFQQLHPEIAVNARNLVYITLKNAGKVRIFTVFYVHLQDLQDDIVESIKTGTISLR